MYATVRRYEGVDKVRSEELTRKVGDSLLPSLRGLPGFGGYYLIDAGGGVLTSVALLEAMSTGVCLVVTVAGGSPAVLGENRRHRVVPPGDPAALADCWRDALALPERRAADGVAARERVERGFDLDTMARHYERIYAAQKPGG